MAALWSLVVSPSAWRSLWFWGNLKKKSGSCNWWTGILGGRLRWEKWSYWGIRYPKLSTREPFEVSVDIFSSSCILEGFVWLVSRFAVLNSSLISPGMNSVISSLSTACLAGPSQHYQALWSFWGGTATGEQTVHLWRCGDVEENIPKFWLRCCVYYPFKNPILHCQIGSTHFHLTLEAWN